MGGVRLAVWHVYSPSTVMPDVRPAAIPEVSPVVPVAGAAATVTGVDTITVEVEEAVRPFASATVSVTV